MNARQRFESAFQAFEPAPDDRPDCIPFYRAFAGLRAAWGTEFCERHSAAVHQAACAAAWARDGDRYRAALATVQDLAARMTAPAEPRGTYFYDAEPVAPTDRDAREYFNREWRRKYPGKRANSKEANARWLELREKALAILTERYQAALADYRAKRERIEQENAKRRAAWQAEIDRQEAFRAAVAALDDEREAA